MSEKRGGEFSIPTVRTMGSDTLAHGQKSPGEFGVVFDEPVKRTPGEEIMYTPKKTGRIEPPHNQERNSILSNADDVFDVTRAFERGGEDGAILTDKRAKHRGILEIVASASREWFAKTKENIEELEMFQKEEAPTVRKSTQRKKTIKKAAKETRQIPHDDHTIVMKKVVSKAGSTKPRIKEPIILKEKKAPERPVWTHVIEENKKDVQKMPAPRYRPPTRTPRSAPQPQKQMFHLHDDAATEMLEERKNREREEEYPLPPVPPLKISVPIPSERGRESQKSAPEGYSQRSEQDTVSIHHETPSSAPRPPVLAPQGSTGTGTKRQKEYGDKKTRGISETVRAILQTLSKNMRFAMVLVATAVGIGTAVFLLFFLIMSDPERGTSGEATEIVSFVESVERVPIPLSDSRDTFLGALYDAVLAADAAGMTHLYPVYTDETGTVASATTGDIFGVISSPHISGAFVRALAQDMMIGTTNNEPFIILRTNAFDVAFAGMISWEASISEDLAPLFGPRVNRSTVRTGATSTKVTAPAFMDKIFEGRSTRVLFDEEGAVRIVYIIINKDTIIITTNTEVLSALVARLSS